MVVTWWIVFFVQYQLSSLYHKLAFNIDFTHTINNMKLPSALPFKWLVFGRVCVEQVDDWLVG